MSPAWQGTWIGDVELVLDEAGVYLTFEEAEGKLIALGFDDDEIAEMLTEPMP